MSDRFASALRTLESAGGEPERFGTSFLSVLPVTGAAVSTVGEVLGSETVTATDDVAARLDEVQFDVTEGPCWEAIRTAAPVSAPRFQQEAAARWPAFAAALDSDAVASMFAFPLFVGDLRFGAVDLYSTVPLSLTPAQRAQAMTMADIVGRHVLRDALRGEPTSDEPISKYSRRKVHHATGIVLAQLDVSSDDALLIMQARAFSTNTRVMEIAEAVVHGRLRFVRTDAGIEADG